MLRVVMDTNALVAARFKREGSAARLMDLCIRGVCRALVSPDVLRENLHILSKVRPSPTYWERVHRFHSAATMVTDLPDVRVEDDPADSAFLACALGGKADYLVSSDRHLRDLDGTEGLRIGPASRIFRDHPEFREDPPSLPGQGNLLDCLPAAAPEEVLDTLVTSAQVRIERIVSHGQASPPGFWYDQPADEWVILLQGRAGLRFEDMKDEQLLQTGDYVHIPAHHRHRVEWTAPDENTVWLAVYYR